MSEMSVYSIQDIAGSQLHTAWINYYFLYIFGGLECVGYSFAYVAHFVFLRDVWIRDPQRAAVASRYATFLAIRLPTT